MAYSNLIFLLHLHIYMHPAGTSINFAFCEEIRQLFTMVVCEKIFGSIRNNYRSGTVNLKSFVGKVLLLIKWKFKLNSTL